MTILNVKLYNYKKSNITLIVASFVIGIEYLTTFSAANIGPNPIYLALATLLFASSVYFRMRSRMKSQQPEILAIVYTVMMFSLSLLYYLNFVKDMSFPI